MTFLKKTKFIISFILLCAYSFSTYGCSHSLVESGLGGGWYQFSLAKMCWYENAVDVVIEDTVTCNGVIIFKVKILEVYQADDVIEYFTTDDQNWYIGSLGDTVRIFYKSRDLLHNECFENILQMCCCMQIVNTPKMIFDSADSTAFVQSQKVMRYFKNRKDGKVNFEYIDYDSKGNIKHKKIEGYIKDGQRIGIWKEYLTSKYHKNLLLIQANFDTGLAEVYLLKESKEEKGIMEAIRYTIQKAQNRIKEK